MNALVSGKKIISVFSDGRGFIKTFKSASVMELKILYILRYEIDFIKYGRY